MVTPNGFIMLYKQGGFILINISIKLPFAFIGSVLTESFVGYKEIGDVVDGLLV